MMDVSIEVVSSKHKVQCSFCQCNISLPITGSCYSIRISML